MFQHPIFRPLTARQRALRDRLKGRCLIIEGNVGAGKSTLTAYVAAYCRDVLHLSGSCALAEDMRPELLRYFVGDQQRRAFATQLAMMFKRKGTEQRAADHLAQHRDACVVMDRSMAGDHAFARMHWRAGRISDEERDVYDVEANALHFLTPLLAVWLRNDVETTLKARIRERNRPAETQFYLVDEPDYLAKLECAYAETMTPAELGCPVVSVDWNAHVEGGALTDAHVEDFLARVCLTLEAY